MSDFFLELYSEEIPHNLQINAREQLDKLIKNELDEKEIKFKKFNVFSTPKRISIVINDITTEQKTHSQEIRGPRVGCNEQALEGFLKSRSVTRDNLITKETIGLHHWEMSWIKENLIKRIIRKIIFIFKKLF